MELKQGETVSVVFRTYPGGKHKSKLILKTSEAVFIGLKGKSAELEFTKPDGGKIRKLVPLRMLRTSDGQKSG